MNESALDDLLDSCEADARRRVPYGPDATEIADARAELASIRRRVADLERIAVAAARVALAQPRSAGALIAIDELRKVLRTP
jgi:hypothetical protein